MNENVRGASCVVRGTTDRRTFLEAMGGMALGALLPHARRTTHHARIDKVGLQLYTVRDKMKEDFEATLARVAQIGYKEVEFAGYFDRSAADVRAILQKNGLSAPSSHIALPDIDAWKKALDTANPHAAGFDIPGAQLTVHTAVVREKRTGHNVAGYLPATVPVAGVQKRDEPRARLTR